MDGEFLAPANDGVAGHIEGQPERSRLFDFRTDSAHASPAGQNPLADRPSTGGFSVQKGSGNRLYDPTAITARGGIMENFAPHAPHAPEPAPRRRRNPWMIASIVLAATVLALGGFLAGQAFPSGGHHRSKVDCGELRDLAKKKKRKAESLHSVEGQRTEWLQNVRTHAYLIKQNRRCFSAEDRAEAHATLDQFRVVS
ncbi:hypothetical protein ABZ348_26195 [Streptomyces sp. NPDC005963]|uniref:hypothetical protein n=1 Tax=Streptomyces sp. NPDC005963 TaxID=3156721 RepID=UPI0033CE9BE4